MTDQVKIEIKKVIRDYHDTYFLERNLEKTYKFYKGHGSVIGSGLDEIGFDEKVYDLYKRDIEQAANRIDYQIRSERIQIINESTVLVILIIDLETEIDNQKLKLNNTRSSILLVKEDGRWLIEHKHISFPATVHEGDEAYPIKELEERNQVLQRLVDEKTEVLSQTIEELRTAQENLVDMNNEKDKFFSIIAHDIKSPFNTILGFTDLLVNSNILSNEAKLKVIHEKLHITTKKAHSLLENLLQWAGTQMKKTQLDIRDVSIYNTCEEVLALFNSSVETKSLHIINNLPPNLVCKADENIVKLVFRNLLSNAIKFSFNNGKIEIYSETTTDNLSATSEWTKIIVKDHGVGISKQNLENVFNLGTTFSTIGTNNEIGNGLGLIFTKDMVKCLGGTISVKSEIDKGTEVGFTIKTV